MYSSIVLCIFITDFILNTQDHEGNRVATIKKKGKKKHSICIKVKYPFGIHRNNASQKVVSKFLQSLHISFCSSSGTLLKP